MEIIWPVQSVTKKETIKYYDYVRFESCSTPFFGYLNWKCIRNRQFQLWSLSRWFSHVTRLGQTEVYLEMQNTRVPAADSLITRRLHYTKHNRILISQRNYESELWISISLYSWRCYSSFHHSDVSETFEWWKLGWHRQVYKEMETKCACIK